MTPRNREDTTMITKSITYTNEAGEEVTEDFPACKVTCPCCDGKKKYVWLAYLGPLHCERCERTGSITIFDADRMDERQLRIAEHESKSSWQHHAAISGERALGC